MNKNNIYFTANLNLSNNEIIASQQRLFSNIERMNNAIIRNWNSNVDDADTVYVLGNLAFLNPEIIEKLKGNIFLILGNHDTKFLDYYRGCKKIIGIENSSTITVDGQEIFLSYYPHLCWPCSEKNTWHLFGHFNNNEINVAIENKRTGLNGKRMNVATDLFDFNIVSYYIVNGEMSMLPDNFDYRICSKK